jgi:CIC family chloride channel protein
MFAPTLFVGAMLGASIGSFEKVFFPHFTGTVGAYALVGMGVLFAAFLRAPLTSVFMVLEMSGNYSIVLPVILSNTIAYLIARSLEPVPIFEVFTHQDGLELPSMEEQREENPLHIEDAMEPLDVPVVKGKDSIETVSAAMAEAHAPAVIVALWDGSFYPMSAADFTSAAATLTPDSPVELAVKTDRVPILFPDLPLDNALHHFPRWPLLPVQNRASRGKLEGMLTLDGVLKRYQEH